MSVHLHISFICQANDCVINLVSQSAALLICQKKCQSAKLRLHHSTFFAPINQREVSKITGSDFLSENRTAAMLRLGHIELQSA